jgi:hypothetical protein
MYAPYILGCLGAVFLVLGAVRSLCNTGRLCPTARTWLLIGAIFILASLCVWLARPSGNG